MLTNRAPGCKFVQMPGVMLDEVVMDWFSIGNMTVDQARKALPLNVVFEYRGARAKVMSIRGDNAHIAMQWRGLDSWVLTDEPIEKLIEWFAGGGGRCGWPIG